MDARGPAVRALLDLKRARIRAEPRSRKKGLGPYRERELAHRAARASVADPAAVAGRAAVIVLRDDAGLGGPPMPAELVEGLGEPAGGAGEGERPRGARVARRHGGVAGETARTDETIGLFVEGREVLVGNRPVRRQTVLVALAEVGGPEARPNRAIDIGRASDPVPHQNLRGVRLDRIVVGMMALVDVGVPIRAPLPGPVRAIVRMISRLDPCALLEAEHIEPALRENRGGERPGGARADNQHIAVLTLGHRFRPQAWVRLLSRSRPLMSTPLTSDVFV